MRDPVDFKLNFAVWDGCPLCKGKNVVAIDLRHKYWMCATDLTSGDKALHRLREWQEAWDQAQFTRGDESLSEVCP